MSHRASVLQLESDFADAMNRLYAVGNGLARLRVRARTRGCRGRTIARRRSRQRPAGRRRRTGK